VGVQPRFTCVQVNKLPLTNYGANSQEIGVRSQDACAEAEYIHFADAWASSSANPGTTPVKVNDEKSTSLCPPRVADHSRGNFCSDCRARASARILNTPVCRKRCRANSVYGQKAIESQHGGNSPHSFLGFCHLRTPTYL